MAYTSRRVPSRSRARVNARPGRRTTRRAPVRRAASGTRSRSSRPQVVKIVIEHSQSAGAGQGGMDLPQIQTQTKKGRF